MLNLKPGMGYPTPAAKENSAAQKAYDKFAKLPYGDRCLLVSMFQSKWTRTEGANSDEWSSASILKLVRQHAEMVKNQSSDFVTIVLTEFAGTADPLLVGANGYPHLHRAILKMADVIFTAFRPLLEQHGFSDDVAGYAKMDEILRRQVESNNKLVVEVMAKTWYFLLFGVPVDDKDAPAKMIAAFNNISSMVWSSAKMKAPMLIATSQSYLHHLSLPPLQRRKYSFPRTIAFVEALLQPLLGSLKREQGADAGDRTDHSLRVVWLLGVTPASEASWARDDLFDDAAAFNPGEDMHLHLIGDGPFDHRWPCGKKVRVFAHTWEDMHAGSIPDPTLVFCCNTGIGTLDVKIVESWLPNLIDLMLYPGKKELGVPVVLTSRCKKEVRGEQELLQRIGAKPFFPSTSKRHVRNLYSGMAGDPYTEYDDNGWLTFIHGSKLQREELSRLACNAESLCQEASESIVEQQAEASTVDKPTEASGSEARSPAVFWGILDLKYDPAKPMADRIKVLESGDGRASKFSGYGAAIKESFQQEHKLEDSLHRSVMVESKKLTHDIVNECGYAHIQPRQGCFPKIYFDDLAKRIQDELSLGVDEYCILKLSNRARGAGVIPLLVSELDEALKVLLRPPQDLPAWFKLQDKQFARKITWGCFEEQIRHWWSNECPCFLVESFCVSRPLDKEIDGEWRQFDGTMRVGFSLHHDADIELPDGWHLRPQDKLHPVHWSGTEDNLRPYPAIEKVLELLSPFYGGIFPFGPLGGNPLRIQWLGGYWKLPVEDIESPDLRGRVVSVAKLGTAPVATADLHEVYAALGDSVPRMFNCRTATQHSSVMKRYASFPELGAFSVARLACSMRARDFQKSVQLLGLARDRILKLSGVPRDLTLSYIERNLGVAEALKGDWERAEEFFRKSLKAMPSNATSYYLLGMSQLSKGAPSDAIMNMEKSLFLDPDFKAPFVNLGVACLQMRRYAEAAEISEAGLRRHPQTSQCLFNKGLAQFALAFAEEEKLGKPHIATELRNEALVALQFAKEHISASVWTEREDRMLEQLNRHLEPIDWLKDDLPCNGCRFFGWRP